MKRNLVLLAIVLINNCLLLKSQDFSFPLYFEDALGNKDTIILGYDDMATDDIDSIYGEIDTNGDKFDSIFEVRISDYQRSAFFDLPYLTKKQILLNVCPLNNYPYVSVVLVKCRKYPLKVKWDKSYFTDSCRNYSFITNWNPGGWFDAGGGLLSFLRDTINCTFPFINHTYIYKDKDLSVDTVGLLYFTFASKDSYNKITNIKTIKETKIKVYLNPINDKLIIKSQILSNFEVSIYNLFGTLLFIKNNVNEIDMTNVPKGLYFIRVKLNNQIICAQKIIKI